jgi:hypothetical protein
MEKQVCFEGKSGKFNGKTAIIDANGKEVIPMDLFKFRTWENKDRLIYSKKEKTVCTILTERNYPFSEKIVFGSENRFFVKNNGMWLIYDFDGKKFQTVLLQMIFVSTKQGLSFER